MAMRRRRSRFVRRRSRPFRRATLRRRTGFKRPRSARDSVAATSDINRGRWGFKRKRLNPRVYRQRLWASSEAGQKYRSNNSIPGLPITANAPQNARVAFNAVIPDAGGGNRFWQPAGGLVGSNEVPVGTDFGGSDLFIRGGVARIEFSNPAVNTQPVQVNLWRLKTTVNGGPPPTIGFVVSNSWDPSLPDPLISLTSPDRDTYKFYKFWGHRDFILKPGEVMEFTERIKSMKIDQDQWINNRNRDFWLYSLRNVNNIDPMAVSVISSWNLSFTGDRVI
ncbi:MAG: coat protein [Himalivirus halles]|uniref:Coat protein n=1 Tax=Cressdnaviricota sp. TaxID=2748378 RepID=A0A345N017_9VIRU|nr:MAG: coat protein [Cressdnaviricota sp.]